MTIPRLGALPILTVAALLCLAATFGCADGVTPIIGEEKPFTVWGYLNPDADTQMVRIFTIEDSIGVDRSGPIDATVTTLDLDTGERREWNDSLTVYPGAGGGHVFWSAFSPEYGHTYRLEVRRSDGAVSTAQVQVPLPVEVELEAPNAQQIFTVSLKGDIPNIVGLQLVYTAFPAYPAYPYPSGTVAPPSLPVPVGIPYTEKLEAVPGGWEFEVNMKEDFHEVQGEFLRNCLPREMVLRDVRIQFLAADSSWVAPGGAFDPDILVEPTAMNNVQNGYGFWGAGQPVVHRWVPTPSTQVDLGFVTSLPCANGAAPGCEVDPPCFRCTESLTPDIRAAFCPLDALQARYTPAEGNVLSAF